MRGEELFKRGGGLSSVTPPSCSPALASGVVMNTCEVCIWGGGWGGGCRAVYNIPVGQLFCVFSGREFL